MNTSTEKATQEAQQTIAFAAIKAYQTERIKAFTPREIQQFKLLGQLRTMIPYLQQYLPPAYADAAIKLYATLLAEAFSDIPPDRLTAILAAVDDVLAYVETYARS